jgi:hypothetical protein
LSIAATGRSKSMSQATDAAERIEVRAVKTAVRLTSAKRCCVRLDYVRCARPVYVDHIVGRGADLFEHMRGIGAEAAASPRGETLGCAGWVRSIGAQPRGAGETVVQRLSEPSRRQFLLFGFIVPPLYCACSS